MLLNLDPAPAMPGVYGAPGPARGICRAPDLALAMPGVCGALV